jgi:hypothetical protein
LLTKRIFIPFLLLLTFGITNRLIGQDNYEIQVYPSETIEKDNTMVELHSNVSFVSPVMSEEILSKQHSFHETLEITHGFTSFFEVGFYHFNNIQNELNLQWVGNNLRPRIRVPDNWNWPVGLSLSTEIGYRSKTYSPDTWTMEIRIIIDKDFKVAYLSFNPTFGKSFKGLNENQPFDFEPSLKIAFHLNKKFDLGAEYYGATGPLFHSPSFQNQEHILYATLDLNLHPRWEFNLGTGWGLTDSTDKFIIKLILGHKFGKNIKRG